MEVATTWWRAQQYVLPSIIEKLAGYIQEKEQAARTSKSELLVEANTLFNEEAVHRARLLYRLGETSSCPTLESLEMCFLKRDFSCVARVNPNFKQRQFREEIGGLLAQYELTEIECTCVKAVLALAQKITQENDEGRAPHITLLFDLLHQPLLHLESSPSIPILNILIAMRRSGYLPTREDQLNDVSDMRRRPCIVQKIIGGGKSSVIATCRALAVAQQGKLPVIVVESSLYQSVKDALKEPQKTVLGQGIFTIDTSYENFTEESSEQMLFALKYYGFQQKYILVVRSEMLQCLDSKLQELSTPTESNTADCVIETIQQLLHLIKGQGETIFDGGNHVLRTEPEAHTPNLERMTAFVGTNCGNEVESERQIEQEAETRQEKEVSKEVQKRCVCQEEFQAKVLGLGGNSHVEKWWKDNPQRQRTAACRFVDIVKNVGASAETHHCSGLLSLSQSLQGCQYAAGRPFKGIFDVKGIFVTKMWRSIFECPPSVFHPRQKMSEHILVTKLNTDYTLTMLAAPEADLVRNLLVHERNTWLIDSSGTLSEKSKFLLDLHDDCFRRKLVLVNIFGGRATSILLIPGGRSEATRWLQHGPGSEKDRWDFVITRFSTCLPKDKFTRFINALAAEPVEQPEEGCAGD